jgi:hypothetical protein
MGIQGFHCSDFEEYCVGLMKTDVLKECVTSIFRLERICERGTALAVG